MQVGSGCKPRGAEAQGPNARASARHPSRPRVESPAVHAKRKKVITKHQLEVGVGTELLGVPFVERGPLGYFWGLGFCFGWVGFVVGWACVSFGLGCFAGVVGLVCCGFFCLSFGLLVLVGLCGLAEGLLLVAGTVKWKKAPSECS